MKAEEYLKVFERIAEQREWRVNPDKELVLEFARGLIENRERYGIATCPCRLVTGKRDVDRLIICPCVYADEDIKEYGRCYCGLYLSREKTPADSVPDRHAEYYLKI